MGWGEREVGNDGILLLGKIIVGTCFQAATTETREEGEAGRTAVVPGVRRVLSTIKFDWLIQHGTHDNIRVF